MEPRLRLVPEPEPEPEPQLPASISSEAAYQRSRYERKREETERARVNSPLAVTSPRWVPTGAAGEGQLVYVPTFNVPARLPFVLQSPETDVLRRAGITAASLGASPRPLESVA